MALKTALSTVHRGVAFEERSLKLLRDNLSMSLRRVGGKSDGGVDLQGWWWLPVLADTSSSARHALTDPKHRLRLRVLGQCKAEKKKLGPNYVREMEGVLHRQMSLTIQQRTPVEDRVAPLVALIISESPFTKAALQHALSSPVPMFLLHLPSIAITEAVGQEVEHNSASSVSHDIGSAYWNPTLAGKRGLLQGQIDIRWERSPGGIGRPGLWRDRSKIPNWTPDAEK